MIDLLRIYGPGFLRLLVSIVLILILVPIILKNTPASVLGDAGKKTVKKITRVTVVVATILYVSFLIKSASVNVTPRGVIDRSTTLDQQKTFEQRHSKGEGQ